MRRSAWWPRRPTELAFAALAACNGAGAQDDGPAQQIVITELGAELRAHGSMAVNDVNSDASAGGWIGTLRATHAVPIGTGRLELLMLTRVDKLTDRRYAGSVIVGDANGRFFEPAPGRTWLLSATWRAAWN